MQLLREQKYPCRVCPHCRPSPHATGCRYLAVLLNMLDNFTHGMAVAAS